MLREFATAFWVALGVILIARAPEFEPAWGAVSTAFGGGALIGGLRALARQEARRERSDERKDHP